MVKPDFWDDEKLATVCRDARLTFIGMWNHSDDYAVVKGNHAWLKSKIFPYDSDIAHGVFSDWVHQLEGIKAIIPFEANGEKFYFIRTFNEHQTINRPSKQRNPEPPPDILVHSLNTHGVLTDETETETETETEVKDQPHSGQPLAGPSPKSGHFQESVGKWFEQIDLSCQELQKLSGSNGKKFNPFQWVQQKANQRGHPGAIDESLTGLIKKWPTASNPWGYINKIFKRVNGNWHEKEAIEIHEQLKQMPATELAIVTKGMLKDL
jgi:hypothetical protein